MLLSEVKKKVFEAKPVFANIYKKNQNNNWLNYFERHKIKKYSLSKEELEKKIQLIKVFEKLLVSLLGEIKTEYAKKSLEENFFVSTADHHGILCHPFFLNSALVRSHRDIIPKNKANIVLSCGGVSLSNSSFPRGIFFHDQELREVRIPLVSLKYRSRPIYGLNSVSKESVQKNFNRVISKASGIAEEKLEILKELLLSSKKIFEVKNLSEQFTIANDLLWTATFGNARGELVYLEMESLTRELLLDVHFKKETLIKKIIFDKKWRESFIKNFEGILGSHNTKDKKGSHLFWHIDKLKNKRDQLFLNGAKLETLDKNISISCNEDVLEKLLKKEELMPTMALCFSTISFYHGLSCGGGFSQVGYLGEMAEAYKKTIKDCSGKVVETPQTDIFSGEFIIATVGKKNNLPATLADLFIYGESDLSSKIDTAIEKTNMKTSLDAMMKEYYKIITGEKAEIENMPRLPTTVNIKRKKIKCIHCGNNPTNHFVTYFMQSITVPLTPATAWLSVFNTKIPRTLAKIVMTPYLIFFRSLRMLKMSSDKNKAFTKRSEVIWEEAEKRGIKMEQFILWGKPLEQYRAKIKNSWKYFESLPLPAHLPTNSYNWMDDKAILKKKFIQQKIPVAFGGSVSTFKGALDIFRKAQKPVIVKPQLGSRGRHTTTHIYTEAELKKAYGIAKKLCHFVVVEEHLFGSVYRGTYVGGEVVGILRGDPPRIIGDGKHTIKELIDIKNQTKHKEVKDVLITPLLIEFISRQNYSLNTIIPKDKTIDLSEKIGISYGGFSAEEIKIAHPKLISYLKKAGDFLNVPVVGFDFIVSDITEDPDEKKWGIIEANSLPFINLHHFPLEGEPVNVAGKVWDLWERK